MRVNHISALTWNHLRVNNAEVEGDLSLNTKVETSFGTLPDGVSHTVMTQHAARAWIREHAPEEPAEKAVAGKVPIYHPQSFGTGLGAEFDEYIENSGTIVHFLEASPGIQAAQPVLWDLDYPDLSRSVQAQIIHVGEGASMTLLLTARSGRFSRGFAGISTKVVLEEGAQLFLSRAQMVGSGFVYMDDLGATLQEGASLQLVQLELGGGKVYVGAQPELVGDHARFQAKGAYLGVDDRRIDINYNAIARGKKTEITMSFDGVLTDRSSKTLRGTIDFRRGAAGSSGREKENVLLLSDDAVNKTLPIILCGEEDMEGSHGATIGRLDPQMLFYLASRGIDEREAERMMVIARLSAASGDIPDEKLRAELIEAVEETFQA